jgi:hypothetical protein
MQVFLSYAFGDFDAPMAARLRAVAAAYNITILLPDRTQAIYSGLPDDTQKKIKQSDAVIALVTRTAHAQHVNALNLELQAAAQAGKPIIPLIEKDVPFQAVPNTPIVYFDRLNPSAHESALINVLDQIRRQQKSKSDLTALGWIVGIALGLVALGEMVNDEE